MYVNKCSYTELRQIQYKNICSYIERSKIILMNIRSHNSMSARKYAGFQLSAIKVNFTTEKKLH